MRGSSVVLVALLTSGSAQAAPALTSFTIDGKALVNGVSRASCASTAELALRFTTQDLVLDNYTLEFARWPIDRGLCQSKRDDVDLEFVGDAVEIARSDLRNFAGTITLADLVGADCAVDAAGARQSFNYCVMLSDPNDSINALLRAGVRVDYDTALPAQPTITNVVAGDGRITLTLKQEAVVDNETLTSVAQYRACPDAGATIATSACGAVSRLKSADANGLDVVVGSLKNGTTYEFQALLKDDFGNVSTPSDFKLATPSSTKGPLSLYNGGDNALSFAPSCASTSATPSVLWFTVLVCFVVAVRRRRHGGAIALGVMLLSATASRAELGQMTVGMGVSPYKPDIDSEVNKGKRIFPLYQCFFGGDTLVEIGGDLDTHLWDGFGSLQVAAGFSAAQARGFAQPNTTTTTCQAQTKTAVELTVAKINPGLVYRFDPLLDRFGFPLVPYARAALVVAGYVFTKDGAFDSGGKSVGARVGVEGALGLMLALDFLDSLDPFVPDATRRGRANGTFDHTFIFVEGAYQDVSSFSQPGLVLTPIDAFIGTKQPILWRAGIAVELL